MGNRVVVGAGKYGINYARILAQNPSTDYLAITRTTEDSARSLAEQLSLENGTKTHIIGRKVRDIRELEYVITSFKPDFVGIASKDKEQGDFIHEGHVRTTLQHPCKPFVLCDKPFSTASGDGASLSYLRYVITNPDLSSRFDLQLPIATIMRATMQDPEFAERFLSARDFGVYWGVHKPEKRDAINNLAPHAWCVPSQGYSAEVENTEIINNGQSARITTRLYNQEREGIPCTMDLRYDQNLRGFRIEDYTIVIQTEGNTNRVLHVTKSLDELADQGSIKEGEIVRTLAVVENPLKINIESALAREVVNGIQKIYASQLFLERVMGYKGT